MGAKYTEAQKEANDRYMRDKHQVRVIIPEEMYQKWKASAEAAGKSVNQYIVEKVEA